MKRKTSKEFKKNRHDTNLSTDIIDTRIWHWTHGVKAAFLVALSFILYGQSIRFGYVLDDEIVITENAFVKSGIDGVWKILTTESFTGYLGSQQDLVAGARYRPLSLITFALEYHFLGLNPHVSHFINVLLYAISVVLLAYVVICMRGHEPSGWMPGVPFIAAVFFAVHPVHTEVVANIKSRDEILSFLFALLALVMFLRFYASRQKTQVLVGSVFFFLGLLAKENAITFLAVIPLVLYFFRKGNLWQIMRGCWPLLVASLLYLWIRYNAVGYILDSGKPVTGLMNNPFLEATVAEKYATIFYTLGLYVKLLFFPHPLTHDYYPYHIPLIRWNDIRAILPCLLYLVMLGYALLRFRKKEVAAFCVLYFVATLSIASNIFFPIGTFMNERFLYMPSLGFCFWLAYVVKERIPEWIPYPKLKHVVSLGVVLLIGGVFSVKTMMRVPDWKDTFTLDQADVKVSRNSARANCFMGYGLYRKGIAATSNEEKLRLFNEATPYIQKALAIHPTYPDALTTKAGLLAGYYQIDGDLKKLLNGFYYIQMSNPVPFVDEYLDYLERTDVREELIPFYEKLASGFQGKGNHARAAYYRQRANQLKGVQ
ncbi:MAG: hypothetical protein KatS3mg031_2073 [Chitinophagales bacterium]|nr:MAG: hypothetical protein KatS3mg031_2073 [Chitinophagales bacterium]